MLINPSPSPSPSPSPWSEACTRDGINNTPLSPYLDQELLYNKHLRVDGSKIETTGFSYQQPRPTLELLREVRERREGRERGREGREGGNGWMEEGGKGEGEQLVNLQYKTDKLTD